MWVVIEGWYELGTNDETIDRLLKEWPDYCELLRRYRNGVFHYQPKLLDERFNAFKNEGPAFGIWVAALYLEFQRFLWEYPDKLIGSKEQIQEIRKIFEEVIGWMPEEIIPAYNRTLEDLCQEALDKVRVAGDTESEAAIDLLSWVTATQSMLGESTNPVLDYLDSMQKKISPDDTNDR